MFPGRDQKIVSIVEARMTSERLPGKVLMPLDGKPALSRLIERLRRSEYTDDVVIATTENREDDPIVKLCGEMGCKFFRGSEMDVLERVLNAASANEADIIVEITGDCPLVDHRYLDKVIALLFSGDYDYAANTVEPTFPDGFDVRIFPTNVLDRVEKLTDDPIDRVHVSYYIYTHPEIFRLANLRADDELYWPELALVLDEKEDLVLLDRIFRELLPNHEDFSAEDVVRLMIKKPHLQRINAHIKRKTPQEG